MLIVVDSVADELMRLMESQHAVKLTAAQAEQLQPVLLKISMSAVKARSVVTGSGAMPENRCGDWSERTGANPSVIRRNLRDASVCRYRTDDAGAAGRAGC